MTSDLNALREGLAEPLARDLAREGGWQDPDAPWTENQVIIARGGAGDPVWREYLDDARSLLGREALTSVLSDLAAARAEIEGLRAERDARPDEVTVEMIAAAWEVVRDRYPHGRVLGPGPGFREAIAAALNRRPLCDLEARIVEAETTAEVDREFSETSRKQADAATARADRLAAENAALREALTEAEACLSSDQPRPDLTEATRLVGLIMRTRGIIRAALASTQGEGMPDA